MRSYLGIRYQGEIHTLSTFDLDELLELNGGFLPPFVYQYHFTDEDRGAYARHPQQSAKYKKYLSWPAVRHADGMSLGAFTAEAIMELANRVAQENIIEVVL